MPTTPNVKLRAGPNGRLRIYVGDVLVKGVVDTTISRDVKRRTSPDGWTEVQPDGEPYLTIKIPMRLVSMEG